MTLVTVNFSPMIPEIIKTGPRGILEQGRIVIAVIGATGTGKSSFINIASGSHLEVGDDLCSCTTSIGLSKPFIVAGNEVVLIDTPGFDDTLVDDADVWRMISFCMASLCELGFQLSGIIYLHRISDFRMGGTSRKNLNVFREICGEEALKNVTVATTMWNEVDMDVGISRELELMSEEDFFRSVLEHGTKMRRHDGSKQSAWDIIEEVLQNCPRTLLIQDELVIQKKDITETSAAREVGRQQAERKRREEKELLDLEEQLLQAKAISDTQTIEELEQLKADLEASVVQMEASRADLPRRSNNEQRRMHQELSNLLELSNAEIVRTSIEENRESEGTFDRKVSFSRCGGPHSLSSTEGAVTVDAVTNSNTPSDKNCPSHVRSQYDIPSPDHVVQHDDLGHGNRPFQHTPDIRAGMRESVEVTLQKMQTEIDNLRHDLARVPEAPEGRIEPGTFERIGTLLDSLVDHGFAQRRRRRRGRRRT
ncbi:hypothetical protein NLI96_g5612 [Meripilus lineatus]|uniref:G domain-containing protein n=1 Tax=Meripilus lineatus TaxID=2056292 RepID=A0AAD5V4J4_9APHY|nr:hypothetical protein NLI96_g5612 [Physisporinus lineatus]